MVSSHSKMAFAPERRRVCCCAIAASTRRCLPQAGRRRHWRSEKPSSHTTLRFARGSCQVQQACEISAGDGICAHRSWRIRWGLEMVDRLAADKLMWSSKRPNNGALGYSISSLNHVGQNSMPAHATTVVGGSVARFSKLYAAIGQSNARGYRAERALSSGRGGMSERFCGCHGQTRSRSSRMTSLCTSIWNRGAGVLFGAIATCVDWLDSGNPQGA